MGYCAWTNFDTTPSLHILLSLSTRQKLCPQCGDLLGQLRLFRSHFGILPLQLANLVSFLLHGARFAASVALGSGAVLLLLALGQRLLAQRDQGVLLGTFAWRGAGGGVRAGVAAGAVATT